MGDVPSFERQKLAGHEQIPAFEGDAQAAKRLNRAVLRLRYLNGR